MHAGRAMTLLFGISEHFERLRGVPVHRQYEERIRLVQRAEEHGFYGYHVSEHHNGPLCMAPSPIVFLSALAQRTSTIRLGTLILILPTYSPLRLIEEICMLDQLSHGRFMPGIGRGVREIEHEWLGIDPTEARERFAELLEILRQGLRDHRIAFRGTHYRFDDLELAFEPFQSPKPPLWWAGNLETAAGYGMSVIGAPGPGMTRAKIEAYWEAFSEARGQPHSQWVEHEPKVGSTRFVIVADTDEAARAIARRAWDVHADNVWRIPFNVQGRVSVRGTPGMNVGEDADLVMARNRALVVGAPDTLREMLAEFIDEVGPGHNYLVAQLQWGDISHDEAMHSLDLYGTEVVPWLAARSNDVPAPASVR